MSNYTTMKLGRVILQLTFMTLAVQAYADDFDCLLSLPGKKLSWNSGWQKDGLDADVPYSVTSVNPIREPNNPPHVVVQLRALAPARMQNRTATIYDYSGAEMICKRARASAEKDLIITSQIKERRQQSFVKEHKQSIDNLSNAPATNELKAFKEQYLTALQNEDYGAAAFALKRADAIRERDAEEQHQKIEVQ